MSVDVFLLINLQALFHRNGPACSDPESWQSPETLLRHTQTPLTEAPLVLPDRP